MKLALGPVLYYWNSDDMQDFYQQMASAPVDIIYLGETVCQRRHLLRLQDYLDIAQRLVLAGKEVILSTQTLIESENDIKTLHKIAENGNFRVEANDMGAVRLLARKTPFVAGSTLNIYNPQTLDLLTGLGAERWVMPVEMSRAALVSILQNRQSQAQTEAYAYGRLPLAFSARCFTARHHNLQKDDCQFKCMDHADGLMLNTREGQPFLTLNGIQTQSALVHNLIGELDSLRSAGVDVLRISPQSQHTGLLLQLFRDALDQRLSANEALANIETLMPSASCNGYWHDKPGLDFIRTGANK